MSTPLTTPATYHAVHLPPDPAREIVWQAIAAYVSRWVRPDGHVVEIGPPGKVLVTPSHPYTSSLIEAIPRGLAGRSRTEDPRVTAREATYAAAE